MRKERGLEKNGAGEKAARCKGVETELQHFLGLAITLTHMWIPWWSPPISGY